MTRGPGAVRELRSTADVILRVLAWCFGWGLLLEGPLAFKPLVALPCMALAVAAFLFYPRLGHSRWRRRRAADLRLRPLGRMAWRVALATPLLLGIGLLNTFLMARYCGESGPVHLQYRFSGLPFGALVLPAVLVVSGPLLEEFAFRGQLQGRLERRAGLPVALVVSAALFAALHGSRAWLPFYFVSGLLLSYLLLAARSLWAPIVLHVAQNGLVNHARDFPKPYDRLDALVSQLPSALLVLVVLLLFGLALLVLPLPRGRCAAHRRSPVAVAGGRRAVQLRSPTGESAQPVSALGGDVVRRQGLTHTRPRTAFCTALWRILP
jgi:membrane protease YdiL (CAAX protease family)